MNPNATLLASSQGNTLSLPGGQLADRLRRPAELHRVRRRRARATRRHARAQRPGLPDLSSRRGTGTPRALRRSLAAARGPAACRSRRAGTARPTWPPGGCSPAPRRRLAAAVAQRAGGRLRDDDRGAHERALRDGAGARRHGAVLGTSRGDQGLERRRALAGRGTAQPVRSWPTSLLDAPALAAVAACAAPLAVEK